MGQSGDKLTREGVHTERRKLCDGTVWGPEGNCCLTQSVVLCPGLSVLSRP